MVSDFKEKRRREYFSGTRLWDISLTNGDHDRFTEEYVTPLRQLKEEKIFASFEEVEHAINGTDVRTVEIFVS